MSEEQVAALGHLALRHGVHDWVSLRELVGLAFDVGADSVGEARVLGAAALRYLIDGGYVALGAVTVDGFHPAEDLHGALEHALREISTGESPAWGMDQWMSNTEHGDRVGHRSI